MPDEVPPPKSSMVDLLEIRAITQASLRQVEDNQGNPALKFKYRHPSTGDMKSHTFSFDPASSSSPLEALQKQPWFLKRMEALGVDYWQVKDFTQPGSEGKGVVSYFYEDFDEMECTASLTRLQAHLSTITGGHWRQVDLSGDASSNTTYWVDHSHWGWSGWLPTKHHEFTQYNSSEVQAFTAALEARLAAQATTQRFQVLGTAGVLLSSAFAPLVSATLSPSASPESQDTPPAPEAEASGEAFDLSAMVPTFGSRGAFAAASMVTAYTVSGNSWAAAAALVGAHGLGSVPVARAAENCAVPYEWQISGQGFADDVSGVQKDAQIVVSHDGGTKQPDKVAVVYVSESLPGASTFNIAQVNYNGTLGLLNAVVVPSADNVLHEKPDIGFFSNGEYMRIVTKMSVDGDDLGILATPADASGTSQSETVVNNQTQGVQKNAVFGSNYYLYVDHLVLWEDYSGSVPRIKWRTVNEVGVTSSNEVTIDPTPREDRLPNVAVHTSRTGIPNLILWNRNFTGTGDGWDTMGDIIHYTGSSYVGGPFRVNQNRTGNQGTDKSRGGGAPVGTPNSYDCFMAVFSSDGDTKGRTLCYDFVGDFHGSEVTINSNYPGALDISRHVTCFDWLRDNTFLTPSLDDICVVMWTNWQTADGDKYGVVGRVVGIKDRTITPLSDEFVFNRYHTGNQLGTSLAAYGSREVLATYTDGDANIDSRDGDKNAVFGVRVPVVLTVHLEDLDGTTLTELGKGPPPPCQVQCVYLTFRGIQRCVFSFVPSRRRI